MTNNTDTVTKTPTGLTICLSKKINSNEEFKEIFNIFIQEINEKKYTISKLDPESKAIHFSTEQQSLNKQNSRPINKDEAICFFIENCIEHYVNNGTKTQLAGLIEYFNTGDPKKQDKESVFLKLKSVFCFIFAENEQKNEELKQVISSVKLQTLIEYQSCYQQFKANKASDRSMSTIDEKAEKNSRSIELEAINSQESESLNKIWYNIAKAYHDKNQVQDIELLLKDEALLPDLNSIGNVLQSITSIRTAYQDYINGFLNVLREKKILDQSNIQMVFNKLLSKLCINGNSQKTELFLLTCFLPAVLPVFESFSALSQFLTTQILKQNAFLPNATLKHLFKNEEVLNGLIVDVPNLNANRTDQEINKEAKTESVSDFFTNLKSAPLKTTLTQIKDALTEQKINEILEKIEALLDRKNLNMSWRSLFSLFTQSTTESTTEKQIAILTPLIDTLKSHKKKTIVCALSLLNASLECAHLAENTKYTKGVKTAELFVSIFQEMGINPKSKELLIPPVSQK